MKTKITFAALALGAALFATAALADSMSTNTMAPANASNTMAPASGGMMTPHKHKPKNHSTNATGGNTMTPANTMAPANSMAPSNTMGGASH